MGPGDEVLTPINAFLQAEKLQTLSFNRITHISAPELTRVQTKLFLLIRESSLLKLLLEKVI
jgi:hypothetical protein